MFKLAEFLVGAKTKLIIGAIVVAVVVAGYFAWKARGEKINALIGTVAVAKVVNESLVDTVEKQEGSSKITEAINTSIVKEAETIVVKHDKIKVKTKDRVKSIEAAFAELPPTPENVTSRNDQTSAALIDGLWESYCAAAPNAASCATST